MTQTKTKAEAAVAGWAARVLAGLAADAIARSPDWSEEDKVQLLAAAAQLIRRLKQRGQAVPRPGRAR